VSGDRGVGIPRSVERTALAIEKERAGGAKGENGGTRSPHTASGGFKLRSAPLP